MARFALKALLVAQATHQGIQVLGLILNSLQYDFKQCISIIQKVGVILDMQGVLVF